MKRLVVMCMTVSVLSLGASAFDLLVSPVQMEDTSAGLSYYVKSKAEWEFKNWKVKNTTIPSGSAYGYDLDDEDRDMSLDVDHKLVTVYGVWKGFFIGFGFITDTEYEDLDELDQKKGQVIAVGFRKTFEQAETHGYVLYGQFAFCEQESEYKDTYTDRQPYTSYSYGYYGSYPSTSYRDVQVTETDTFKISGTEMLLGLVAYFKGSMGTFFGGIEATPFSDLTLEEVYKFTGSSSSYSSTLECDVKRKDQISVRAGIMSTIGAGRGFIDITAAASQSIRFGYEYPF